MKNERQSVLIADDNRAMAQGLRYNFEQAGYSVYVTHDGGQAAVLAARQRFDLIVTDLEMPVMTGTEFCRHVREDLQLKQVPIAVCSANGRSVDKDQLEVRYGIRHIFFKPVNAQSVTAFAKETVDSLIGSV